MNSGLRLLQVDEGTEEANDDGGDDKGEDCHGDQEEGLWQGWYAEEDRGLVLHAVEGVDTEGEDGREDPGEEDDDAGPEDGENWVPGAGQHGHQQLVHLQHGEHDHVLAPDEDGDEAVDVAHVGGEPPLALDGDGQGDREDGEGSEEVDHTEIRDELVTDELGLDVTRPDDGHDEHIGQDCGQDDDDDEEDLGDPRHEMNL